MNKQVFETNGIKKELTLSVHTMNESEFGKSATLKQDCTITYPSKRMDTGFGKGLFDSMAGKAFVTSRYALIKTPADATNELVEQQLKSFPQACIYRVLSNDIDDIISDSERSAIKEGFTTLEAYEDRYEVQDGKGNRYAQGKVRVTNDGEVVEQLPKEFKRDIFSTVFMDDRDFRQFKGTTMLTETAQKAFSL